jgi:AcrR family transcriptional regulator
VLEGSAGKGARLRGGGAGRRVVGTRGYGATSIETIAAEAGVTVRTVYAAFDAKREILSLICEQWLDHAGARTWHLAVPLGHAQAMFRALAAPGVYRELVEESGWSPEDFERWVRETLQRNLLAPAGR